MAELAVAAVESTCTTDITIKGRGLYGDGEWKDLPVDWLYGSVDGYG